MKAHVAVKYDACCANGGVSRYWSPGALFPAGKALALVHSSSCLPLVAPLLRSRRTRVRELVFLPASPVHDARRSSIYGVAERRRYCAATQQEGSVSVFFLLLGAFRV